MLSDVGCLIDYAHFDLAIEDVDSKVVNARSELRQKISRKLMTHNIWKQNQSIFMASLSICIMFPRASRGLFPLRNLGIVDMVLALDLFDAVGAQVPPY